MRASRGLAFGALVGMGAGSAVAVAVAALLAISIVADGDSPVTALGFGAMVAVVGSLIGGTIGTVVGMVLGLIFGATGSERHARWITPALLLLPLAAAFAGEPDASADVGAWLVALILVGALGALGFAAGVVFDKLTAEGGRRPSSTPPPADIRLQEVW